MNAVFVSPSGERFELQFHIKSSFDIKQDKMHMLDETYRSISTTADEKERLTKQMEVLSSSLEVPADIEKIR